MLQPVATLVSLLVGLIAFALIGFSLADHWDAFVSALFRVQPKAPATQDDVVAPAE